MRFAEQGAQNLIRHVVIYDSTSTIGGRKTGLAFNTAGLTCYYLRAGGTLQGPITLETINTLGTYQAPTSNAHIRFKEVSSSGWPGLYELHIHNDWLLGSNRDLKIVLHGASGMVQVDLEIDTTAVNFNNAASAGISNLDAAISTRSSHSAADVWSSVSRTLTAFAFSVTVGTNNDKTGYSLSSAGIQAIWDALTSSLTTAGSIGKYIIDNLLTGSATAAAVWTYATRTLTQTVAQIISALTGSNLVILRGDTLSVTFTGLGNISARTKLWFSLKIDKDQQDSRALVQIEETGGLLYLNGNVTTTTNGSIVVNNATTGSVTITLKAEASKDLPVLKDLYYDIQILTATSVNTLTSGSAEVTGDITRAVS